METIAPLQSSSSLDETSAVKALAALAQAQRLLALLQGRLLRAEVGAAAPLAPRCRRSLRRPAARHIP